MLLDRPVTALMLVLATFIFGWIALQSLSVDLLPDVDRPSLLVQTEWSGASAREVETRINEPLEAVMSTIPGISSVHSFARQGQSIIALNFEWGRDMNLAFLNTREKLDQVRMMLPEQAGRPRLIYTTPTDEPVAVLSVTASGQPDPDFATRLNLKRWSEHVLTRRLEQQEGIAQAVLVGAVVPEVHIRFRQADIDQYGLSIAQIREVIRQANVFSASGELRDGWYRYSLSIQSRIQSIDDIRMLAVTRLTDTQRILRLHEIADVYLDEQDPTSFSLYNGSQVLTVLVKKDYGSNTVRVFESLGPLIEEITGQYPGIQVEILQENASYVKNTIQNLLQTLAYGGILAFIVLFVFLNDPRMPFTIGIAIPASIFLTFFVMYLFGIQLNIISLSGLTLGIGLLVDNAIVVLENINRYRKYGHDIRESAHRGTRGIALAVTASTFTTISVFLPLLFLGGFEGAIFRDQAFTLSVSLLASLLVALGIIPVMVVSFQKRSARQKSVAPPVKQDESFAEGPVSMHDRALAEGSDPNSDAAASRSHKEDAGFTVDGKANPDEKRNVFARGLNRVQRLYEGLLQLALGRPALVIVSTLILGILAGWMFWHLPKTMLPEGEPDSLQYRVSLPGNTSLLTVQQAARDLSLDLAAVLESASPTRGILVMGGYTDQTNLSRIAREGLNKFTIQIAVPPGFRAAEVDDMISERIASQSGWTLERLEGDSALGTLTGGNTDPVILQFVGTDRVFSERVAEAMMEWLPARIPGSTLHKQYPEVVDTWHIRFNSARLLQLGLTENQVIDFLESRARGNLVTEWNREDESIAIRLFSDRESFVDPQSLVMSAGGRNIPLRELLAIEQVQEPEQLERAGQAAVLSYRTGFTLADWWFNGREIRDAVREFTRETGIEVRIAGSALMVDRLLRDMLRLLGISLILIYIILAVQYESLRYPALILVAVPFAWIGSLFLLHILGGSLNMLSFMGLLILTGIAVNDAILKVDFMRRYLEESGDLSQAIIQAGKHRFRPVLMTTMTTILGLLPMLIPFGDGYEFRQALATALIGGMFTSTLLTLFVIPVLFRIVNRNHTFSAQPSESL